MGSATRCGSGANQAGLPQCSTHSLRKAGVAIAAENGATDDELVAIFEWVTKQQTALYTKGANRRRIAENAIHKLVGRVNSLADQCDRQGRQHRDPRREESQNRMYASNAAQENRYQSKR